MAENVGGVRRPLAAPGVYSLVQRLLGAEQVWRHVVGEFVRPSPGERILDLGCGPGRILDLFPDVEYTGIDLSAAYIDAARERFGDRGRFLCMNVTDYVPASQAFDAVIALGMVHHLGDETAKQLHRGAADALTPSGRLITIDPAFDTGERRLARWLIERDRGQNVRDAAGYRSLAERSFGVVDIEVKHDLAHIPYTHAIMTARSPKEAE